MCLAIPARLVELRPDDQAVVDLGGIRKEISIALVADVQVGDYVIVHVGHAIGTIDPEEAERTLALFAEMARMNEEGSSEPHAVGSVGAEVLP
ncbi:HypC/HybG/HupF family hydrogenase formation chaperone [Hydrogenophaga laconesensis]|uniref:Hydrogenase expression/formation protein HypC n=1 Tax=Hydrogenophaga laconesensis TaxID=1805971 RepID=A0ABU1VGK7_9BURK|nr:HypC/HybG/HupF family hydrogenase formation chaperone [Hydrogenophaga laconesensis]MDR7096597.1 hydrogenase expression/formation protein HypC [Hydrogenophaga laconesensis]